MRIARFSMLLSVYLAMGCSCVFSQKIAFKKISSPTDYPFSLISGMAQDSAGYLWFTSGPILYRYDGYEYTSYSNDPSDTNSISASIQECILIDRDGLIWTGDVFTGLNVLNPSTEKFRHYRYSDNDATGLLSDHISALAEDNQGNIWIGTVNGINIFNKKTNTFIRHVRNPDDPESLSSNDVITIYKDREGIMWIGCGGAFRDPGKDRTTGGLNKYDASTGKFIHYLHDTNDPQTLSNNLVQSIFEDSRGIFWVGTVGEDGLQTLDRKTGKFTRYRFDPKNPARLSRLPVKDNIPYADDHVTFIQEDVTGAIWIGTFETGVTRYDPKANSVTRYAASDATDSLHETGVWSVFETRDRMIWIGSWELGSFNLYLVDPAAAKIGTTFLKIPFDCFFEDTNVIYAGGSDGLVALDKNKHIIKKYTGDKTGAPDKDSLSDTYVYKIIKDKTGLLWLGTDHGGLNSFDPRTEKFTSYKSDPVNNNSIDSGLIVDLLEDREGIFWVGVTNGLNIMDKKTGSFRHLKHDNKRKESIASDMISSIRENTSGDIWVGTGMKGGLNKLVRRNYSFEHFLEGFSIEDIFEDSRKVLWVATNKGLYRKEKTSDNFIRYEDLNLRNEPVYIRNILEDDYGNLYAISLSGIHIIDTNRTSSTFYPLTQNWSLGPAPYLPVFKLQSGEFLIGYTRGYYHFFPDELLKNHARPQIVVADFYYTDKEKNNHPLSTSGEVNLSHDQNTFSMKFAGIHFASTVDNQHMYKLDGYDETWRKTGSERTAYFYNIPPGSYTLHIAASDNRGDWSERSFKIVITPPWWSTWWFRTIAMLGIIAIFYGLIRWRTHEKFRRKLEQSEKEKQLADLRHKTSELEIHALRAQMNPHFIFNSLNSINRFILQSNKNQASQYLTKFSKLVRLVFHNSQSSLVTLDSELEALDIYLELEKLRFDNHFEYHIIVHEEIDSSALLVPPLIIQPFAENAIWHGLMHKDECGHLSINISMEDDTIVCKVTDDGIGRKKSAEIKNGLPAKHKSMGMRITSDRIALLQQQKLMYNAILVNDLILPDGSAGGTEVIIKLPIKYD